MKFLTLILLLISFGVSGQPEAQKWTIAGEIINSTSKQPVVGRLVYESLPYGNKIGIINGHNFRFSIPEQTNYTLKIKADGFAPFTRTVKSNEFQDGRFFTIISLVPTGANQLIRLEKLIFDRGKAKITNTSYQELNTIVKMMKENVNMKIQLEGHTDFRGNPRQNMRLSEDRVKAVRKYLIRQGIPKRRIKTKAFGGEKPLSRGDDRRSRVRNRRVEVRILSN